ncbi:hypothetical protein ACFFRR_009232 [Megaselia abdita]
MECVVCTELLDSSVCACIPCGHVFHLDCLGKWLTKHKNCPMCRKEYGPSDMQILFLPKDETNPEKAREDEEIKKKWEIYTISDKVKPLDFQEVDENLAMALAIIEHNSEPRSPQQTAEEEISNVIQSQPYRYQAASPSSVLEPRIVAVRPNITSTRSTEPHQLTAEEEIINRVTSVSTSSDVIRSQPSRYQGAIPSSVPEPRIAAVRPNNTSTRNAEPEDDDCECGGGRRRRRRKEKASPMAIAGVAIFGIIVFIVSISASNS